MIAPDDEHLALTIRPVSASPTLAADERVRRRIASGAEVLHLAFGEAGLPVMPGLAEVLARGAADNRYGSVAGAAAAREAAAGWFVRRGVSTTPDQILFAPGSKALLYGLLSVLPGDVVLPRPSWVSYAAQAALVGKRVWHAPIGESGGVPDPDALDLTLKAARAAGGRPVVLVLTLPDNPTGTVASPTLVTQVVEVAEAHGLLIVSDEIYRDLAFEGQLMSPVELLPGETFVTGGLSKSMALGGWRIGFARMPNSHVGGEAALALIGVASEIWSSLAAPMQEVAAYVLSEPPEVRAHIERSRRLHENVSRAAYERIVASRIACRPPGGGFYLYPDLDPIRDQLARAGVETADGLASLLLERFGIAVLSGTAFGDSPSGLRFRISTSLLYGRSDEERWEALASDDPSGLPWISRALDTLGEALATLAAG